MAHVRQQIRDAVALAIATNPGVAVEKSRQWPMVESAFPRYLVYSLSENVDESMSTSTGIFRVLQVVVEALVIATPATVDIDLDNHAIYLEKALNYTTLDAKALKVVLRSSDMMLNTEGDLVMGVLTLTFDVTYRTAKSNPEAIA